MGRLLTAPSDNMEIIQPTITQTVTATTVDYAADVDCSEYEYVAAFVLVAAATGTTSINLQSAATSGGSRTTRDTVVYGATDDNNGAFLQTRIDAHGWINVQVVNAGGAAAVTVFLVGFGSQDTANIQDRATLVAAVALA